MNGEEEINHMKKTLLSHHLMYEAKGLQSLLEYQFWVTASTKIGEGQSSKIATQILSSNRSKDIVINHMNINDTIHLTLINNICSNINNSILI